MKQPNTQQPDAEDAEVAQKTQKKPLRNKWGQIPIIFFFSDSFLRLLRNFCVFCVRYFSFVFECNRFDEQPNPLHFSGSGV
jgi:hypothetical protein